jgi:hypothetical protein
MPDLPVFPIISFLAASKATSYRQRIMKRGQVLAHFLEYHRLSVRPLTTADGQIDPNRNIMESDLTDEGRQLMKNCLSKWLSRTDRGGDIDNVKIMQDGLAMLRSESPKKGHAKK